MASKQKMLQIVMKTLKEAVYYTEKHVNGYVDDDRMKKMENAIDLFIEESASTYTKNEINANFSSGEKAMKLLYAYIEMKSKDEVNNLTLH